MTNDNNNNVSSIAEIQKSEYLRPVMTEDDHLAAKNLRVIWKMYKAKNQITQIEFVGPLGWTQGNFSQYLTGKVSIGMKALLKLADALECDPGDIRNELRDKNLQSRQNNLARELQKAVNLLKQIGGEDVLETINSSESTLDEVQFAIG
jgi:DNA-binding Xre family transcriptional regulator